MLAGGSIFPFSLRWELLCVCLFGGIIIIIIIIIFIIISIVLL